MSVSRHPVALRLEQQVGEGTRLLATVMALPLLDGIFPALVLAGAIDSVLGILEVGLLVFGGSATLAVILAEMDGTRREQVLSVLTVGVFVIALAALEAAVAPTIRSLLDLATFERFAALVILAVAAKTASSRIGELLPRPAVIIGLGLVASFEPAGAGIQFVTDPMLVARGVAAAGVGVAFALSVALFGPTLRGAVDLDPFRFGSAVALGILPLSLLGLIPENAPLALAVLAITGLLAFDPRSGDDPADESLGADNDDDDDDGIADDGNVDIAPQDIGSNAGELNAIDLDLDVDSGEVDVYGDADAGSTVGPQPAAAEGLGGPMDAVPGAGAESGASADVDVEVEADGADADSEVSGTPGTSDGDRAPWL